MIPTHDIHNDIESWLAAAVHEQLTPEERAAFHEHLATCASCRALHQEELTMSNMISSSLAGARPDLAFEQRMVRSFRGRGGRRARTAWIGNIFRNNLVRTAAVVLILFATGVWLTSVRFSFLGHPDELMAAAKDDHSLSGLQTQLSWPEQKAEMARREAGATHPVQSAQNLPAVHLPERPQAPAPPASAVPEPAAAAGATARDEKRQVTDSSVPSQEQPATAEFAYEAPQPSPGQTTPTALADNRKLIRNAQVEVEVLKFEEAVQQITGFTHEAKGYIATTSSERQANGKLRGEIVAKVLPEHLDSFLQKLRGIGDVQNQTLGTEDVTKQYFDTDSRLNSARTMEQRLLEILRTKTGKVSDLLEVEKELGRVRAQIEEMQGSLKYLDAQVQFATVTIDLAEKDLDVPAAFVLKRRAQLALFSTDVEKTFEQVKGVVDGAKAQISSSTLDRDSAGEATARLVLLIVPEEADAFIERVKGMGRVQSYNEKTDRVAKGGSGMSDTAKVERDKVELHITISRNEQEPALQNTSLGILTSGVSEKVARLKESAATFGAEVRRSSFHRAPDGQESASVSLRVAMKNYAPLVASFDQLGKVKDVMVNREDRGGVINEDSAPADIHITVYTEPGLISEGSGFFATLRRTLTQGVTALMWSLRMVGVALAFFAPWVVALAAMIWAWRRVRRARRKTDAAE